MSNGIFYPPSTLNDALAYLIAAGEPEGTQGLKWRTSGYMYCK